MLGVATAATVQMAKVSKKPGVIWPLMGPYLGWLAFATALNFELLRENNTVRARARGGGGVVLEAHRATHTHTQTRPSPLRPEHTSTPPPPLPPGPPGDAP